MNITIDIEATVAAALTEALAPERLHTVIKDHVTKLTDRVIADMFQSYGDFSRKTLEPAIKAMLPHELRLGDDAAWTHYLKTAITERLAAYNDDRFQQALAPLLDQFLVTPPKTIKLSELVDKAVEQWADHYSRDDSVQPTVIVRHGYPSADGIWISMDPREDRDRSSCRVQFGVNGKGRGALSIYGLRVDGDDTTKTRVAGPAYGFEAWLLALQTSGSVLEIDQEYFGDVYYPDASEG
jgi:hypothetical protein